MYQEGHLAISSSLVKELLTRYRSNIDAMQGDQEYMDRQYKLLAMICPDCSYAWTNRVQYVKAMDAASLGEELRWLNVLQMLHLKSGDAWSHRRLVLTCMSFATDSKLITSELDFIAAQAERHPHHYYAMNHFNWLSSEIADSVAIPFLQRMLTLTPLHYGVYHHLLRRLEGRSLTDVLEIGNPAECYRTSESFCQFVYVAALQRNEKFPALTVLQGDEKWPVYFRTLVSEL